MGDWVETKLGELIEVKYGKDHKNLNDGAYPVYGSGGLMRYADNYLYDGESILIPRKGSLNNIFYKNEKFWTVDTMFWSKVDETKAFPKFLYYNLKDLDWLGMNVGSAVPSLTVPVINGVDVSLPQLPEQKAIAEVLSSLDDKIDLLHRQNKTLESLAETLFRRCFFEGDGRIGPISEILEFNPSLKLPKGVPATYLEMGNLSTTTSAPNGWRERQFTSGMKFQNGDALLARITPCLENGKAAFVNFLSKKEVGWGSTEFIVMRSRTGYHPLISYLFARNSDFKDFAIANMSGSSGRQRVDASHLKKYESTIPSLENLEKLNQNLEQIAPKLEANLFQIIGLETLLDTLLPKLMNGDVRVETEDRKDVLLA